MFHCSIYLRHVHREWLAKPYHHSPQPSLTLSSRSDAVELGNRGAGSRIASIRLRRLYVLYIHTAATSTHTLRWSTKVRTRQYHLAWGEGEEGEARVLPFRHFTGPPPPNTVLYSRQVLATRFLAAPSPSPETVRLPRHDHRRSRYRASCLFVSSRQTPSPPTASQHIYST